LRTKHSIYGQLCSAAQLGVTLSDSLSQVLCARARARGDAGSKFIKLQAWADASKEEEEQERLTMGAED
jgi:hypothetical protein